MLLKETVGQMVEETKAEKRQASETPEVNTLVQDLYELVRQAVELTIKAETHGFTDSLVSAFGRMKTEMEKQFQQFQDTYKTEMHIIDTDCRRALKTMKNELIEDRLRVDKKISGVKQTIESLVAKVKTVENSQLSTITSSTCIGLCNERSGDENVNTTVVSVDKADTSKKTVSLEDSLNITEIEDRYEGTFILNAATIRGLWNVVTDVSTRLAALENKLQPEEKPKEKPKPPRKSIWQFK